MLLRGDRHGMASLVGFAQSTNRPPALSALLPRPVHPLSLRCDKIVLEPGHPADAADRPIVSLPVYPSPRRRPSFVRRMFRRHPAPPTDCRCIASQIMHGLRARGCRGRVPTETFCGRSTKKHNKHPAVRIPDLPCWTNPPSPIHLADPFHRVFVDHAHTIPSHSADRTGVAASEHESGSPTPRCREKTSHEDDHAATPGKWTAALLGARHETRNDWGVERERVDPRSNRAWSESWTWHGPLHSAESLPPAASCDCRPCDCRLYDSNTLLRACSADVV